MLAFWMSQIVSGTRCTMLDSDIKGMTCEIPTSWCPQACFKQTDVCDVQTQNLRGSQAAKQTAQNNSESSNNDRSAASHHLCFH
jgi:hypothetical protein